jgi:hypothetical protein
MQAATLTILEKRFTHEDARIIAEAIEIEVAAGKKELPTRSDVQAIVAEAKFDVIKTAIGLLIIGLTAVFFMLQHVKPAP